MGEPPLEQVHLPRLAQLPEHEQVTVHYTSQDGTATAGPDYSAKSWKVTFNPGQTLKTIVIRVKGDGVLEPYETFTVHLFNPSARPSRTGRAKGSS